MDELPIAKALRASRNASYDPDPMIRRVNQLLNEHHESYRHAALNSGLDHQAVRRILDGHRPFIHICILLADHFGVNPNELLELAGWPRLKSFDLQTGSAENLPIEAVDVAFDIAKITDPGTRKEVAIAIRTLLKKYFAA